VCQRLFYLEVDDFLEDTTGEGAGDPLDEPVVPDATGASALVVSLHALAGICTDKTLLPPVLIKGERLLALMDMGSTHNFLNGDMMSRLGLAMAGGEHLRVTVANGDRLPCVGIARDVPVIINNESSITCVGMRLGCFDFILGVDFLETLGTIQWNFRELTLSFRHQGRRIHWQGVRASQQPAPQQLAVAVSDAAQQPLMDVLLQQHDAIFDKPTRLPPARYYDHRIHLLPGTAPVAVWSYLYAQLRKDELERQCEAMLAQGIIRPSTSPFSAPVLLVRKADRSWRFCIDYRALNAQTSKDKFPIPVVDELLDEFHGARFFSKLDLRSGYHQVRVHTNDIAKTAFCTHHGHYEFLVMSFGLSNAPTTFQALMNDVLRPYLRRFVLVFFDDILIYSTSRAEHLQHVSIVLESLRAHTFI
jgi:hypothetical protein